MTLGGALPPPLAFKAFAKGADGVEIDVTDQAEWLADSEDRHRLSRRHREALGLWRQGRDHRLVEGRRRDRGDHRQAHRRRLRGRRGPDDQARLRGRGERRGSGVRAGDRVPHRRRRAPRQPAADRGAVVAGRGQRRLPRARHRSGDPRRGVLHDRARAALSRRGLGGDRRERGRHADGAHRRRARRRQGAGERRARGDDRRRHHRRQRDLRVAVVLGHVPRARHHQGHRCALPERQRRAPAGPTLLRVPPHLARRKALLVHLQRRQLRVRLPRVRRQARALHLEDHPRPRACAGRTPPSTPTRRRPRRR